jgi:predicted nuclease of predicted toxin-antitoxin system
MKIQLFLDEDVHSGLAHALRKRGYDAIHAQELDRKGRSDLDQLFFAIEQEHWGIIVSKQLPFRETMSRLLNLLQRTSKEKMKNYLEFL